jgi:outer membrane protein assembly factor BamB
VAFKSAFGGPGPRATPTIFGGRVYTVGATGLLDCLDGATGKTIWNVNILEDNESQAVASHGVCGSPLIVDDRVIVCPTGANGISLAAYECESGKRVWQGGKHQASYGSPLLTDLGGVRQILLNNSFGVAGHDAATGKVLWSFEWTNGERTNCSQTLANVPSPGQVFISTGYGQGCALLHIESADKPPEKLWDNRFMKTKFTTAVFRDGYFYGLDEGILESMDAKTGQKRKKGGRYGHGHILLAGDLLIVQAENGEVVLVEANPGLKELGRSPALSGKTWNNPALAGKYLLVRNDHEAACLELAVEKE